MIAFWQETVNSLRPISSQARETLLRKLNHYAFEHIDIICVFDAGWGESSTLWSISYQCYFTEEDDRQQIAILSTQQLNDTC